MWRQLKIRLRSEHVAAMESLLLAQGALAVSYLDGEPEGETGARPVFQREPGAMPLWDHTVLLCLFDENTTLEPLLTRLRRHEQVLNPDSLAPELIADRDWERCWMADFKPMQFGEKLWICPGRQDPPDPDAVNIRLDPGLAFGSGSHATTALCLRWLNRARPGGRVVIDYGCGSGVLAIAAVLLGAERAHAVDHDPQAITATLDNSRRNDIPPGLINACAPEALPAVQADLLLANILAEPLLSLAPEFAGLLRPGGRIALSGVLVEQLEPVLARYGQWFDMDTPVREQGWGLLSGVRKA